MKVDHLPIGTPFGSLPYLGENAGKSMSPFTSNNHQLLVEGSLEVKLPTIWTDEKQSRAEAERRERLEERRSEKRKSQKKEDADARKGRKVAKHCVFPMICGSGGSKSRLAKAAGAEPSGQTRDEKLHTIVARSTCPSQNVQKHTMLGPLLEVEMSKKCTPLWREAHFEVKMYKTHHVRATFGRSELVSRGRRKGLYTFSQVSKT